MPIPHHAKIVNPRSTKNLKAERNCKISEENIGNYL